MKKALLSLVCLIFVAVAVSGCCGTCPFQKKDNGGGSEHPTEHPM